MIQLEKLINALPEFKFHFDSINMFTLSNCSSEMIRFKFHFDSININRQPAQLPGSDNVVDAFAPGQAAGKKTIEQKPQPAATPQDFRKAPERELIPAEEAPQSMPDEGFMMPEDLLDNELPFK